ncbi:hypothetical protein CUT44_16975 [Streptomyces carminius]|uniref:Uncharacterized protein n=1 Tax=Streptomyces carminius TaxID=2665496 RepID=A0A2M8LXM6_9ACTN|nr:hypothetical protein [Streptomyces carminius]PJE96723.1 hypothetical protein CUT44_16975 [Streptomyces carminius]
MLHAVGLVPPGERREEEIGEIGQFRPQFAVLLEVYFTDAQQIQWYRDTQGKLHRDRSAPA